jgi:hypothetical protein
MAAGTRHLKAPTFPASLVAHAAFHALTTLIASCSCFVGFVCAIAGRAVSVEANRPIQRIVRFISAAVTDVQMVKKLLNVAARAV